MNKLTHSLIVAGIISIPAVAMADDKPALSKVLESYGTTISGYVDAGYTDINSTGLFTNGGATRVFDAPNAAAGSTFSHANLNQVGVTIAKAPPSGFGGLVNFTGGQDANIIASYGAGLKSTGGYTNNHSFDVTQAYGSYATGPVTVILGKFATLAGAEVIPSMSDTNYSRSILFGYAIPFTHTGARLTYAVTDTVSLIAGVNNGWDQVQDSNSDKTAELGFTAAPNKMFSFAGSYYGGKELAAGPFGASTTNGNRNLVDLVATVNATDSLSFVANYDNGSQANATLPGGLTGTAKWDGLALYANYMFNSDWRLSFRTEYLNDKAGYRTGLGVPVKWSENTLTLAYMPAKDLELRGEVREDHSNDAVNAGFLQSNGTSKSNQTSLGLEAIYKF
ncbi:MAG: outer membrane beta-barrel protein [Burkholderiales bacterium]